jgi:hypothetical protein
VFVRDPDAILAMSELSTDEGKIETYRQIRRGAPNVIPTGWRISATLREFPTPPDFDIWFDWPLHYIDEGKILASTSDRGEHGVSPGQTKKADAVSEFITQFEMETQFSGDNAVSSDDLMALLEIKTESTLKSRVSKTDKLMQASVMETKADGNVENSRVVTVKGTEEIVYGGVLYVPQRDKNNAIIKNRAWLPKGQQTTL